MADFISGIRSIHNITLLFIFLLFPAVMFAPAVSLAISPLLEDSNPPPAVIVPPDVLWDQTDGLTDADIASQDFRDGGGALDAYDSRAADDFLVPDGMYWKLTAVKVYGSFDDLPPDQILSLDVVFYFDKEGLPGQRVGGCVYEDVQPENILDPSFMIVLQQKCLLEPGRYWVSVRANMQFLQNGQWFWHENTVLRLSLFVWENPGDGFSTGCIRFSPAQADCGADFPDLAYQLTGIEYPIIRPIPTLGEWGMIVTAVTLGFIVIAVFMNRKRVKA